METTELSRLTFEAIASSSTAEAFEHELAARGIQLEWTPNRSGIKLLPVGASTWQKGSTINRELSGAKIIAALQRNADLRLAAEQASAATIAVADDRAKSLTATRVNRNEALDDITAATGITFRALPPAEADAARAQAAAGPDPLSFLSPPETTPPMPDDAALAVGSTPPAAGDGDEDAARARRERAAEDEDLASELRAMTAKQLVELRNSAKRPLDDAIIAAALLEKLLALAMRILSFGAWRKSTPMADLLASRGALADAADEEIARRHRTPATVRDRMRALVEHRDAINSRAIELDARQTAVKLAALRPGDEAADLRQRVTEAFDAAQVSDGKPTTSDLKAELFAHGAAITSLLTQAPGRVARLRGAAAVKDWESKMLRAKQLRALTAVQLDRYIEAILRVVAQQEAAKAAKTAETNAVLVAEAEGLAIEIRDRVPALRAEIERDAQRERLRLVGRDEGDSDDGASRMRG